MLCSRFGRRWRKTVFIRVVGISHHRTGRRVRFGRRAGGVHQDGQNDGLGSGLDFEAMAPSHLVKRHRSIAYIGIRTRSRMKSSPTCRSTPLRRKSIPQKAHIQLYPYDSAGQPGRRHHANHFAARSASSARVQTSTMRAVFQRPCAMISCVGSLAETELIALPWPARTH